MSDNAELPDLRTVADYQFGAGAGAALFPENEDVRISRSTSGRPRQIHAEGAAVTGVEQVNDRIVSYSTDGRFTLGIAGGRRLAGATDAPTARVVVGDESEPFVRGGKNVFAKFVRGVDPDVRPGDEVVVVRGGAGSDEEMPESVLGVGRAELSASAMLDFETGMAVKLRQGAGEAE